MVVNNFIIKEGLGLEEIAGLKDLCHMEREKPLVIVTLKNMEPVRTVFFFKLKAVKIIWPNLSKRVDSFSSTLIASERGSKT